MPEFAVTGSTLDDLGMLAVPTTWPMPNRLDAVNMPWEHAE